MDEDLAAPTRASAIRPVLNPDSHERTNRSGRHSAFRFATGIVAVVALAALAIGGFALWPDADEPNAPAVGDELFTTEPSEPGTSSSLPEGWREITLGDVTLGVPGEWTVESFGDPAAVCPNTAMSPTVFVLHAGYDLDTPCISVAPTAVTLELVPESLVNDNAGGWAAFTTAQGLVGERRGSPQDDIITYRFEQFDLWLQFSGPDPLGELDDHILATLLVVDSHRPAS